MIYSKTSPVGIDVKINSLQTKIHAALLAYGISVSNANLVTGNIDLFPRIYKMKEGVKITPVKFITEFQKPLFSTDKVLTGYFYDRLEVTNENGLFNARVGNIFHVDLSKFYPSITHRADHEFVKFMTDIFGIEPYGFRLINYACGMDRVYNDFNFDETFEDVHPYFSVRFDLNINFRI